LADEAVTVGLLEACMGCLPIVPVGGLLDLYGSVAVGPPLDIEAKISGHRHGVGLHALQLADIAPLVELQQHLLRNILRIVLAPQQAEGNPKQPISYGCAIYIEHFLLLVSLKTILEAFYYSSGIIFSLIG
jgi:hypothetical protein